MKYLKLLVLSLCLSIGTAQSSKAAVAGVMAIAGSGGAGALALKGLYSIVGGLALSVPGAVNSCNGGACLAPLALGSLIGLVILDEEAGQVSFCEINNETASKLGLSNDEVSIYNSELSEANLVFEEVQSQLVNDSTLADSKELWNEMSDVLSPETFKVMKSIVKSMK